VSSPVTSGIRIIVPVEDAEERGIETEILWAERVTADTFRLNNSPFFASGLSSQDVLRAEKTPEGWHFREVVSRGGHSTYRVYLTNDRDLRDADIQQAWQPIADLGATYESANGHFFAVDIPPGKDIDAIYDLLDQGEAADLWTFEEVHYEPPTEPELEPSPDTQP
jgi:hypothetical protein